MMAGAEAAAIPAAMRQPVPAFPLPRLRLAYLRAAYAYYGIRDAWL